ncbi:hypothetical protein CBS101457_003408 [Exobasidium rhododendri]|nr:hypothetical protein CBS101457_003408 [Exobasidium rhododendri]
MPPPLREVFGDTSPIPFDQLRDDETIRSELVGEGKPFNIEDRLIDGRLQTVYKGIPPSARAFWQMCGQAYSKRTYIVFEEEKYTYGEIYLQSIKAAYFMRDVFQIRKGDMVGIGARNYPEFVVSFWAIHLLGAVACPLNSFNDGDTLAFCIRDVSCRIIIVDGERYDRLEPYLPALRSGTYDEALHAVIVLPRMGTRRSKTEDKQKWVRKEGIHDWEDLMDKTADSRQPPDVSVEPEDNATILFTSGTTGRPKGVLSTQRQYISTLLLGPWGLARSLRRRNRPLPTPTPAESLEQNVALICVPLMHVTGLLSGLTTGTAAGNCMCLLPAYSKQAAIKVIERERVATILGVGWMIREIAKSNADLSSIQAFLHGGAPSAKELVRELSHRNTESISTVGYGMSELNGAATNAIADDYHAKPTSVGYLNLGVEIAIVDPQTEIRLQTGERGEIWFKSPCRAKGYWNRPKENEATFLPDGWLRTGDIGYVDSDGCVFIVDRVKDIIIRGGENIACSQVENAVYSHKGVLDCTVVALPEPSLGERVAVVCVVAEGADLPTSEQIISAASKSLPRYAVPEYVWVRREPLERNLNGKVLKAVVRNAVLARAEEEGWKAPSRDSKL